MNSSAERQAGEARGDSKDTKELASRYKSKLQSQSSQSSNSPAFTNDLAFSAPANVPTGGGYGGGGMPSDGRAELSGKGGMGNGRFDFEVRNNFGVFPPTSGVRLEGAVQQSIAPNQSDINGNMSMGEFKSELSLVVTAPQETTQETTQHYMTSLAISLPARGTEYFFTTPRGDAVLSANGISKTITQRLIGLVMLLAVVAFLSMTRASLKRATPQS